MSLFPCRACAVHAEARDAERKAHATEMARGQEREHELLAQLKDLTSKLTALADLRAQALIAQAEQGPPSFPGNGADRRPIKRPLFVSQLANHLRREPEEAPVPARPADDAYRTLARASGVEAPDA